MTTRCPCCTSPLAAGLMNFVGRNFISSKILSSFSLKTALGVPSIHSMDCGNGLCEPCPTDCCKTFEIERKFSCGPDTEALLKKLGATFCTAVDLRDVYYDSEKCQLCLTDTWLRRRNGSWELKYASASNPNDRCCEETTKYVECENESEITALVHSRLGLCCGKPLNELVIGHILCPIADVSSRRRVYSLDGCTVTLDFASDLGNLCVGEVELMCDQDADPLELSSAIDRVNQLAQKLGMSLWGDTDLTAVM